MCTDPMIYLNVSCAGMENIDGVVDTGATRSCVSNNLYMRLKENGGLLGEIPVVNFKLIAAVGRKQIKVTTQIMTKVSWDKTEVSMVFLVVHNLFTDIILGLDWARENDIVIYCRDKGIVSRRIDDHQEEKIKMEKSGMTMIVGRTNYNEEDHEVIGGVKVLRKRNSRIIKEECKVEGKMNGDNKGMLA